jgi:hypothetical protein
MRGSCLLTAALVLSVAGGLCCGQTTDGWTLVFKDDFERGTVGFDWDITRGDWRIEKGRLVITRPGNWMSDSVIRLGHDLSGRDVRLEFDLELTGPWSAKGAVKLGEQWWDGGGPEAVGDVHVVAATAKDREKSGGDFLDAAENRTYRVAIEHRDGVLRAWVDGRQVKEKALDLDQRHNDGVGFYSGKNAAFDNVKVYARPYVKDPRPQATPETNRRATVDAARFLDPKRPDCGFQEAVDSLPPTGGAVILPRGTFVMRQPLYLRHGVAVRGQGKETVLALSSPIVWSALAQPAARGDATLQLQDASRFEPGMVLAMGKGDAMYDSSKTGNYRVAKVEGNVVHLSKAVAKPLAKGDAVGNFFPMIWAANDSEIEVRDLAIDGRHGDPAPFNGGYGASGLSFFFVREARVDNVHIDGWKGDAFSFQGGRHNTCTSSSATRALAKGFHPGSCQRRMIMTRLLADGCGDDGLFFCRYNQESVMSYNVFTNNRGAMIGGLASAGDHWNVINFNYGENNRLGVPFTGGANDVFYGNVIVNSGVGAIIDIAGGKYDGPSPHQSHPYAGPSRYHVIVGNTLIDTRADKPIRAISAAPGAEAMCVAGNRYSLAAPVDPPVSVAGTQCVVADNKVADVKAVRPEPLPPIPPLPEPIYDAAPYYDPAKPDCGFQAAIDDTAKRGGGTVRLPAGVYPLRQGLTVPSKVTLCGEGVATALVWGGDMPAAGIRVVGDGESAVRRLRLARVGGDVASIGVHAPAGRALMIEQVTVEGFGTGIMAREGREVRVQLCRAVRCERGFVFQHVNALSVLECQSIETRGCGLEGIEVGRARIEGNVIWRSRGAGAVIYGREALLQGNVVSNSGMDGAFLHCKGGHVAGNVILNSSLAERGKESGLRLLASEAVSIIANRIGDDTYDATQVVAIREEGDCAKNVIRHNVLAPNFWPRTAKLDKLLDLAGKDTVAEHNVLAPYPPQEGAK